MIVMRLILEIIGRTATELEVKQLALETILTQFGWVYGGAWAVTGSDDRVMVCTIDAGTVAADFRSATVAARFAQGVGLPGQAWANRDFVFLEDVTQSTNFPRAKAALASGVKSGFAFPLIVGDEVEGAMEFFSGELQRPSYERLQVLRSVGFMVSTTVERIRNGERLRLHGSQALAAMAETQKAQRSWEQGQVMVEALGRQAVEIGRAVRAIGKIAAQTKMLALNASIEAARAGDTGRGFAVVAHGVKELAASSATATEDIGRQIKAVHDQAQATTQMITEGIEALRRVNAIAETLGD